MNIININLKKKLRKLTRLTRLSLNFLCSIFFSSGALSVPTIRWASKGNGTAAPQNRS